MDNTTNNVIVAVNTVIYTYVLSSEEETKLGYVPVLLTNIKVNIRGMCNLYNLDNVRAFVWLAKVTIAMINKTKAYLILPLLSTILNNI
jgi:hypothetical protein